ncbi:MAG: hypothetical protein IH983_00950 [Planctomycetes bacterium]|nr:hypothetical protein [Planctomycetota bacterium]
MSGDPRDILRLKHCPECGYDLATLPRDHRCPECGFEYDASMFIITGNVRHARGTWGELAAYVALTLLMVLPVAAGRPAWGPAIPLYLLAMAGVPLFGWLYRRRLRARHGGDARVLITDEGVALLHDPWSNESQPWSRFAEVKVRRRFKLRRTSNRKWRLRLKRKRWHPLLGWDIDVVLDGTQREAALLRNEIRRRIQTARNG